MMIIVKLRLKTTTTIIVLIMVIMIKVITETIIRIIGTIILTTMITITRM